MPIKRAPQLEAWSFSRYQKLLKCPLQLKLGAIDRIREPEGPAMVKGKQVEAEALVHVFKGGALPTSCELFPEEFAMLRKLRRSVRPKLKIAFDKEWRVLCAFEGSEDRRPPREYFSPAVWLRMEYDLFWEEPLPGQKKHFRVRVVDLKTGKVYEDKLGQIDLYLLTAFLLPASIVTHKPKTAFGEMWYLDQGEVREKTMLISEVPKAKKLWTERAALVLGERQWNPKPGEHCRFCFYRKSNAKNGGGQCPY